MVEGQKREAILREYGDAGIVIEFTDTKACYSASSYDALVVVYRDKEGKVAVIEIEFEDGEEEDSGD